MRKALIVLLITERRGEQTEQFAYGYETNEASNVARPVRLRRTDDWPVSPVPRAARRLGVVRGSIF